MRGLVTALFTLLGAGVVCGACASGTQLGSGGAGGATSTVTTGTGGAGGGATSSSSSSTASTTSSSSGGSGGGAPNPCEGVACDTPPPKVCSGSDLVVYASAGTCSDGQCTYGKTTQPCPNGCANGACNGDPCLGVTCNQAAASYCVDASHLRVRDLPGTCDAADNGACVYTTHDEFCAFGCTNGACDADPCLGVVCPAKPSSCSDASTLVQYDAGQCTTGLPCTYGSTSVSCANGCVNGQCVVAGCAPPAAACQAGGNVDGNCATAYVISRTDAGSSGGFVENNGYGLCNRNNDFTDNTCGGGSGSDAAYKLFMRQGETANIQLTRGTATCASSWGGNISLKIFQAACDASCNCSKTTCATNVYCTQSNNQSPAFVAPADGWYTIVVDSVGPVADKGGVYYLSVKLTCAGGNCGCT